MSEIAVSDKKRVAVAAYLLLSMDGKILLAEAGYSTHTFHWLRACIFSKSAGDEISNHITTDMP